VITDGEATDARPDLLDDSRDLVAAAVGEVGNDAVRLRHVIVGVAEARGDHTQQHLVVTGFVELHVDHVPCAGLLAQDGGSCPHRSPLVEPPIVVRVGGVERNVGTTRREGTTRPLIRFGTRYWCPSRAA
jgi:hypothetical protein